MHPIAIAVTFGLKPLSEIEKAFPAKLDRALINDFTIKVNTQRDIKAKAQPSDAH